MSALPPKADIDRASRDVRFVPKADIGSASGRLGLQDFSILADEVIEIAFAKGRRSEGGVLARSPPRTLASQHIWQAEHLNGNRSRWKRMDAVK